MNTRHLPPIRTARTGMRGLTLIELMIVVVVVAILAGLAFPSFMDSIRKSRRSEAFTALNSVQQAQERFRGNNAGYTTNLTAAPTEAVAANRGLGLVATTPNGYYSVTLPSADGIGYEVVATAVSGTSQAKDGDCAKLGIKLTGGNIQYAATTSGGTLAYAGASKCWNR